MRAYPSHTIEDVYAMPWHRFTLFLGLALGGAQEYAPKGAVDEAEEIVLSMARWREKHGVAALPRGGMA